MKKIIIFIMFSALSFAETVSVDLDFLLKSHPKLASVQNQIVSEKTKLEKDLNGKAEKLKVEYGELVKKGDKITDAEKQNFSKKDKELSALFLSSQKSLAKLEGTKINSLVAEIKKIINDYSKKKNYDSVVEKKTIYYGANKIKDISNDILSILKTQKK